MHLSNVLKADGGINIRQFVDKEAGVNNNAVEELTNVVDDDMLLLNSTSLENFHQSNALLYIAGHVVKKYLHKHNCSSCRLLLVNDRIQLAGQDIQDSQTFMKYKAYSHLPGDFGGLMCPSESFVCYLNLCESVFLNMFEHVKHTPCITVKLTNTILSLVDKSWFTVDSCVSNLDKIVKDYVRMRVFYSVKYFNDSIKSMKGAEKRAKSDKNGKAKKLQKLQHL